MSDNEEESINEMCEEDIDEELGLPSILSNLKMSEKRELLTFKRNHNERDWEEEILRRQDLLTKKIDLERLKKMQRGGTSRDLPKLARASRTVKSQNIRSDSEDSEDLFSSQSESEGERHSESEDENLFDSDEEEAISSKFKKSAAAEVARSKIQDQDVNDDSSTEESRSGIISSNLESPPATLADYLTVQLRRNYAEKWLKEPYFEKVVESMFVRLFIGQKDGISIYRMAQIKKVERGGRPYKLTDLGILTTTRFVLEVAGQEKRNVKIDVLSNSRITQGELNIFLEHFNATRTFKPLTKQDVIDKKAAIKATLAHKYTNDEVSAMVKRNLGMNKSVVTDYSTAKSSLLKRMNVDSRQRALDANDVDELEEVNKTLDIIEREIQAEKEIMERSTSFKYVSLNRRNKEANFQKDLKAGIKKRKLEQLAAIEGPTSTAHDPFVRRETQGQNLWKTGSKLALEKLKLERDDIAAKTKKMVDEGGSIGEIEALKSRELIVNQKLAEMLALSADNVKTAPEIKDSSANISETVINTSVLQTRNWGSVSLDEARSKVKHRLGVDPLDIIFSNKRKRYLLRACSALPAFESAEREKFRSGLSLVDVFRRVMLEKDS